MASNADEQTIMIESPLLIMFKGPDERVITHIHPPPDYTHHHYGILICDLVRHVAGAMKVREEDVWDWVDRERENPTSQIERPS